MAKPHSIPGALYAWLLQGEPRLIGEITKQSSGDVGLTYSAEWLASGFALSADMPLRDGLYTPVHHHERLPAAPGALDDARPDRWGEKVIRYLYRPGAGVYENLYFAGDERFGAIGVSSSRAAYIPFDQRPLPRLSDAQDLSDAVKIIIAGETELDAQRAALVRVAGSLGGAKPKAVIRMGEEEWVLKFYNAEPFDQPLVEHATMTLATKAGLNVAITEIIGLVGENAVAVKRFDRYMGRRMHCISACTLLRSEVPGSMDPEFGYPQLARALRKYADIATLGTQLRELFGRMVFNILMANTDDHEKNHALLCHVNGRTMRLELSPGYDIVPTGSGAVVHQFMITDTSHEPDLRAALSMAPDFGLDANQAAGEIRRIAGVVDGWQDHYRGLGVTERDITELAAIIDSDHLMEQRKYGRTAQAPVPQAGRPSRRRNAFEDRDGS